MLALQVPCDARMIRRDVNSLSLRQHIPASPAHSVLLGEPVWGHLKVKAERSKVKEKSITVI